MGKRIHAPLFFIHIVPRLSQALLYSRWAKGPQNLTGSSLHPWKFSLIKELRNRILSTGLNGAGAGIIRDGLGAYGERILGSSSKYVQSNVREYFSDPQYYFQVNGQYVRNKLKGHWTRITEPVGGRLSYKPLAFDINAPDLYIPLMSFGTYVVLASFKLGLIGKFSPEALSLQFTKGLLGWFLQVLLLKVSLYSLGSGEAPLLDTSSKSQNVCKRQEHENRSSQITSGSDTESSTSNLCMSVAEVLFYVLMHWGFLGKDHEENSLWFWPSFHFSCGLVFLGSTRRKLLWAVATNSPKVFLHQPPCSVSHLLPCFKCRFSKIWQVIFISINDLTLDNSDDGLPPPLCGELGQIDSCLDAELINCWDPWD
ncbi:hypothetical protein IFM89_014662 [Coptis chinensis]|uniref:Uncharacterized protein n=1 Tax=Coptis chinensis TaxID=261450 RepID=A0A835LVG2_9MAGN|nr:hypothetical protein IFM89_014662 [Coptis chinensis]